MSYDDHSAILPVRGIELERWRTSAGLTSVEAAAAFGMNAAKWRLVTAGEEALLPITDPAVAMLFHLYSHEPESAPARPPRSVPDFYAFLGFEHKQKDYERFARLVGRSPPSVIRLLHYNGNPSRALSCWIDALTRLRLSPRQTLQMMENTVAAIADGGSRVRVSREAMRQRAMQEHHG